MPLTSLYEGVKDSVVRVIALDSKSNVLSNGTGSLIEPRVVLTCEHCVLSNMQMAIVDPADTRKAILGNVIFADSVTDIALIEFQQDLGTPVAFSSSSNCKIGNGAFVVGFPMG